MGILLLAILKFIVPFVVMALFIGGFFNPQPNTSPWYKNGAWVWGVSGVFALLVFLFADLFIPAFV